VASKKNVFFTGDQVAKQVSAYYEKMASKMAKEWDTDIVFCLCHGNAGKMPAEMDFDKFYIFIQLLPKSFGPVEPHHIDYYKINGEKLTFPIKEDAQQACPQGDCLRMPSEIPSGVQVIRDEEGTAMAVIEDGSLYILNDFIHSRSKEELEISIKIFEYLVDQAVNQTDVLKHLKSGVEEKSKRALEIALKNQFITRLEKEKVQLKAAKDTVTQYMKGIVDCERKMLATDRIIKAIQNNLADIPVALSKTWAAINRMDGSEMYESISFMKTGLKAISTPITVKYSGKEYDMGRYEVTLNFNGETAIHSVDHAGEQSGYDHPHVSNGRPCWGNMSGQLPKLIGQSEYDVALTMVYTFLSSYDSASPYRTIDNWPEKKKEKKKAEVINE
jgi:hypothetical protein